MLTSRRSRLLVTGGCGFIGSRLVEQLLANGHPVTVLDDLSTGSALSVPSEVDLQVGSVLDAEAVAAAALGSTLVVHLAAVVGHRLVSTNRRYAHQVAAAGTATVLAATSSVPVVVFSSSAVYGDTVRPQPVTEQDVAARTELFDCDGGADGYATGKWEAERHARLAAHTRPVLVVRPFNIVGPTQSSAYGMVLPSFVDRAVAGQPIIVYDDGHQVRSFGDVDTFVQVIWRLLLRTDVWRRGGMAVNVGNPLPTTIGDLAELVRTTTKGGQAEIRHQPYQSVFPGRADVRVRVPDVRRLHSYLGDVPWQPLATIVEKCVAARVRAGAVGNR